MRFAEASHAQGFHSLSYGQDDGWFGYDQAVDDDEVYFAVVEGFLPREAGVSHQPVAKVFRFCEARNENVRHDCRFDQCQTHVVASQAGLFVLLPAEEGNHASGLTTTSISGRNVRSQLSTVQHGYRLVTSARQRFPQIPDQSPRHAIRQDNPRNNAVFIGMCDPGNEPYVSIDRLDIDAGRECVGYHQRFGQRRVFLIVTHRSSQNFPGPHLSVGYDGSPSKLSPEADGAKMGVVQHVPDRAAKAEHSLIHSGQAVTNPHSLLNPVAAADAPEANPSQASGAHLSQAGSPSRGAVAPSSSGIESGPANQFPQLFDAREGRGDAA